MSGSVLGDGVKGRAVSLPLVGTAEVEPARAKSARIQRFISDIFPKSGYTHPPYHHETHITKNSYILKNQALGSKSQIRCLFFLSAFIFNKMPRGPPLLA